MALIGIGTISLVVYILSILILNVFFKRKMAEAMLWSFLLLLIIGAISGADIRMLATEGLGYALKQEVVYASMAFVYMAYVMSKTGVIVRLVNILNSLLGRVRGGAGYVSTIASALFGMISGSGSGNASAVGSITIPWMEETGWSKERATTIVAGNAGLGMIFPPSSSMFLLLGMEAITASVTSGQLYVGLMGVGVIVLIYRLFVVYCYVRKDKIQALPNEAIRPLGVSLRENGSSLAIFLGVFLPILVTMGPFANYLTAKESFGAAGLKSISMILWIPILIALISMIEGRKFLPNTLSGWLDFNEKAIGKYSEVGCLLFFAFAASRVLIKMGLESEITAIFGVLGGYSSLLVIIAIAALTSLMVGPFTGTATTTAIGALSFSALTSIGLAPVAACTAFLNLTSNEGCIPPNSAPIYIASGISGLENPGSIFKPLLFHYALPTILIAILIMLGIIPVFG